MGNKTSKDRLSGKVGKVNIPLLVHISDLHIGSEVGIWPTDYKTEKGAHIGQNDYQKWLWGAWIKATKEAQKYVGKRPCAILINGDVVEGIHHKTKEVNTAKVGDQVRAAVKLFKTTLPKYNKLIVVRGTPCHVEENEGIIGSELGAMFNKEEGCNSFSRFYGRFHGCLVEATHHMPCGTRAWTEGTAMAALMNNARASYVRAGLEVPKVYLRAHRHRKGFFCDGDGLVNVNGAWQGLTQHGHKVVPEAICQPSITILDWTNSNFGDIPDVRMISVEAQKQDINIL